MNFTPLGFILLVNFRSICPDVDVTAAIVCIKGGFDSKDNLIRNTQPMQRQILPVMRYLASSGRGIHWSPDQPLPLIYACKLKLILFKETNCAKNNKGQIACVKTVTGMKKSRLVRSLQSLRSH